MRIGEELESQVNRPLFDWTQAKELLGEPGAAREELG
jgi:hypothetical protein